MKKQKLLEEFGLFLFLLGIVAWAIWLQFKIPTTGSGLVILGAVLIFIAKLLEGKNEDKSA